jgi:integrase
VNVGLSPLFQGSFNFDFHSTRRTFLTLLSAAGVSDTDISVLAGHRKKGVLKHYVANHMERYHGVIVKLPFDSVKIVW